MSAPFRVLIIAGEASGDLHGGGLVRAMKEQAPHLEFQGVGGKHMQDAGVDLLFDIQGLGAMGAFELFHTLGEHIRIYRHLRKRILNKEYDAAILINYPAFNLLLGRLLKKAGCPSYFYISPQVWVSRPGRIETIRRTMEKIYVILPFEEPLFQKHNVPVEYLGHPFIDLAQPSLSSEEAAREFELEPDLKTVGLLPGSRKHEIEFLLDDMLEAAKRIHQKLGRCRFLLPVADTIDPDMIHSRIGDNPLDIRLVYGRNYDVMQACDFLILASGSATLEAALFECPMVIIYKVNPWSYKLFRRFFNVKFFGLVNVIADEEVVPELLNEAVTPERLADEALKVLEDPEFEKTVRARLHRVRASLGEPGVLQRIAASMIRSMNVSPHAPNEKASA